MSIGPMVLRFGFVMVIFIFLSLLCLSDTDEAIIEMRATELLNLMKEATKLREQKCYTLPDGVDLETYKRKR